MNEKEIEDRFIVFETKIAYLEEFTSELQEVVVEHTKTIDKLAAVNKALTEKIEDLMQNEEIPNRKPPHY